MDMQYYLECMETKHELILLSLDTELELLELE